MNLRLYFSLSITFMIKSIICLLFFIPGSSFAKGDSHQNHHEKSIELGKDSKPIKLKIKIFKDSVDGWNLRIHSQNFIFSPKNVGLKHIPGEGHAHLYVGEKKIARVYEPWFHLSKKLFKKGKNTVKVSLHANSHEQLAIGGKLIETTVDVIVK